MTRPVLILEHEDESPPGLFADWLDARGLAWERTPQRGPIPERPTDYAAVVSLGSADSANGTDDWVSAELAFVQRAIAAGVPVLGLCFGGQLLARAAGGTVARRPPGEFGWIRPSGAASPITEHPWFCWHDDAFTLPPGAELLADGPMCPQAYALGPHLGLQFHPEVDHATIDLWLAARARPRHPALDLTPTIEANQTLLPGLQERAFELFDWWLERSGIRA